MKPSGASVRVAPPWTRGKPLEAPYSIPPGSENPPQSPVDQTPVAIIVSHGMGQQVPFETLELVAQALRSAEERARGARPDVVVRRVKLADGELSRAEITLTTADGKPRHVHLYETYWAPITEGKVTLRDTTWFLLQAAWAGFRNSRLGAFTRFLFNAWQAHRVGWRTQLGFLGALLVTVSLLVMNSVIVAVTTLRVATGPASRWTNSAVLGDLTAVFALFIIAMAVLLGAGIGLPARVRGTPRADGSHRTPGKGLLAFSWVCVWFALLAVIAMAPLIAATFIQQHLHEGIRLFASMPLNRLVGAINQPVIPALQMALIFGVWGGALLASAGVRGFLVQYVGDVAAYVSSHTVNRFYETRRAIQDAAFKTVRDVYLATAVTDGPPLYARVVMVGHSLGSVIAYDMLNAIIRHDSLLDRPTGAADRTAMLLTFGSPLDKTAFIFRTQSKTMAEVREASAAAMQSIITGLEPRRMRWVNIWNKADWISGSLDFYDPPERTGPQYKVENIVDLEATTPIVAHTEYWSNRLMADTLYGAIIAPPASESRSALSQ